MHHLTILRQQFPAQELLSTLPILGCVLRGDNEEQSEGCNLVMMEPQHVFCKFSHNRDSLVVPEHTLPIFSYSISPLVTIQVDRNVDTLLQGPQQMQSSCSTDQQ